MVFNYWRYNEELTAKNFICSIFAETLGEAQQELLMKHGIDAADPSITLTLAGAQTEVKAGMEYHRKRGLCMCCGQSKAWFCVLCARIAMRNLSRWLEFDAWRS